MSGSLKTYCTVWLLVNSCNWWNQAGSVHRVKGLTFLWIYPSVISKQMQNEIFIVCFPTHSRHKGSINLGVHLVCLQYCISADFTPSNYTKKHFRAKMFNLHWAFCFENPPDSLWCFCLWLPDHLICCEHLFWTACSSKTCMPQSKKVTKKVTR